MSAGEQWPGVPPAIAKEVRAYADRRVPPGQFLRHVIANDLFAACGYAGPENAGALPAIARMVFNVVPGRARGTYPAVDSWIRGGDK